MFGIVLNISNAIIGLTLLAWGNSLGGKTVLHAHSKPCFPAPILQTLPELVTPLKGHSVFMSVQQSTDAVSAL